MHCDDDVDDGDVKWSQLVDHPLLLEHCSLVSAKQLPDEGRIRKKNKVKENQQ